MWSRITLFTLAMACIGAVTTQPRSVIRDELSSLRLISEHDRRAFAHGGPRSLELPAGCCSACSRRSRSRTSVSVVSNRSA